jgi:hypothetical protein
VLVSDGGLLLRENNDEEPATYLHRPIDFPEPCTELDENGHKRANPGFSQYDNSRKTAEFYQKVASL